MTESYGPFSELLVLTHLARTNTGAHRIFYLERLLDQATDFHRNSWESAFEQAVFDRVASGRTLASSFESLAQHIASRNSSWHGPPIGLEFTPESLAARAHRVIQGWIGELETEYVRNRIES